MDFDKCSIETVWWIITVPFIPFCLWRINTETSTSSQQLFLYILLGTPLTSSSTCSDEIPVSLGQYRIHLTEDGHVQVMIKFHVFTIFPYVLFTTKKFNLQIISTIPYLLYPILPFITEKVSHIKPGPNITVGKHINMMKLRKFVKRWRMKWGYEIMGVRKLMKAQFTTRY